MFDDAFRPIARDGADNLEVMIRLQKVFTSIYNTCPIAIKELVTSHSRQAYERAEIEMKYSRDLEVLKKHCVFNNGIND